MDAMNIVFVAALSAVLQSVCCGHTNVFVKFLSPPSGYSHLQLTGTGGVAVTREERIYPGDPRHATFQPTNSVPQKSPVPEQSVPAEQQFQRNTFQQGNQFQSNPFQQGNQHQGNTFQQSNRFLQDDSFRINQAPNYRYSQQQQSTGYYYPPPPSRKPFEEYGPPRYYQGDSGNRVPEEPYLPSGEYYNPDPLPHSQAEATYDPQLISGPSAAQYVAYLFNKGELFFHLIPHERLVLMNQQDRIKNNLAPHVLGSIRPGHPFFIR